MALLSIALCFSVFVFWRNMNSAPERQRIDEGVRFLQSGRFFDAEKQWREAVRLDPQNVEAWQLLGDLYFHARDFPNARQAFEHVLKLDPSAPVRGSLAVCALQSKDTAAAERYAKSQLEQTPNDIVALQTLARVEQETGDSDARLKHLNRLSQLQPQSADALAEVVNELGKRQEYDQAVPAANRLVRLAPNLSSSFYLRGLALFSANHDSVALKKAAADFQKASQLSPQDAESHRFLGRTYLRLNQPRLAVVQFEAVGHGRPYASAHLLELSKALRLAGNTRRADEVLALFTRIKTFNNHIVDLSDSINNHPSNADNFLSMGLLLLRGPESDEALFQLYRYRFLKGKLKSVSEYVDRASQLKPEDARIRGANAQLEAILGRRLQAVSVALAHHDDQAALQNMAHALLLHPRSERTRKALQPFTARGLDPLGTISSDSPSG